MQVPRRTINLFASICVVAASGCYEPGTSVGAGSFQSQYSKARTALESGRYQTAIRYYGKLVASSGPFKQRIQLELAHAHLRAGEYARAAQMSGALSDSTSGTERSAALSVHGTAMHELGLGHLSQGNIQDGKSHLIAARKAFSEVLKKDPDLDPLGSLAGRNASITARLKKLS